MAMKATIASSETLRLRVTTIWGKMTVTTIRRRSKKRRHMIGSSDDEMRKEVNSK